MIKIITDKITMPPLYERRFQTVHENNKWQVIDTHNKNTLRYKGLFENVSIACHSLNKNYYSNK